MPWHGGPTKGAGSRDSPGGAALRRRSRGARMGEPDGRGSVTPKGGATGGTETSKYPEERKSTRDCGSSGERNRKGPNRRLRHSVRALRRRGCGRRDRGAHPPGGVRKPRASGSAWEGARDRVRAPYAKARGLPAAARSTAGHEEPGGKQGGPPSKAKYHPVTDSGRVP